MNDDKEHKAEVLFNPFLTIGLFWFVFGIMIFIATFFVSGSSYVPQGRGIFVNLVASFLLLLVGGLFIRQGRKQIKSE